MAHNADSVDDTVQDASKGTTNASNTAYNGIATAADTYISKQSPLSWGLSLLYLPTYVLEGTYGAMKKLMEKTGISDAAPTPETNPTTT